MASLSLGLTSLVEFVRQDKSATDYHLHGYARLVPVLVEFVLLWAISCKVSDAVLRSLMADDRVARCLPDLEATLEAALQWLLDRPASTWDRLATIGKDVIGADLRGKAMHSGHVQAAFMRRRFLLPAAERPWSLARGNIQENFDRLLAMQDDDFERMDLVTKRLVLLLRLGYDRSTLEQGCRLLGECSWFTIAVEQGHGSCATVRRFHKECSGPVIASRALLHQSRFWFNEDPMVLKAKRVESKLVLLEKRCPSRCSGQHMFVKDLLLQAGTSSGSSSSGSALPRSLMAKHGGAWAALSPAAHAFYDRVAADHIDQKQATLDADKYTVRELLAAARPKVRAMKSDDKPARLLSLGRFTEVDPARLGALMKLPRFSHAGVAKLCEASWSHPSAPTLSEQRVFERLVSQLFPPAARSVPMWLRVLCKNREVLETCIVYTDLKRPGICAYLLLYAVQSPMDVAMLPLSLSSSTSVVRPWQMVAAALEEGLGFCLHEFRFQGFDYIASSELPFDAVDNMFVVPDCFLLPGRRGLLRCPGMVVTGLRGEVRADADARDAVRGEERRLKKICGSRLRLAGAVPMVGGVHLESQVGRRPQRGRFFVGHFGQGPQRRREGGPGACRRGHHRSLEDFGQAAAIAAGGGGRRRGQQLQARCQRGGLDCLP